MQRGEAVTLLDPMLAAEADEAPRRRAWLQLSEDGTELRWGWGQESLELERLTATRAPKSRDEGEGRCAAPRTAAAQGAAVGAGPGVGSAAEGREEPTRAEHAAALAADLATAAAITPAELGGRAGLLRRSGSSLDSGVGSGLGSGSGSGGCCAPRPVMARPVSCQLSLLSGNLFDGLHTLLVEFEDEATRDAWAAATRALQLRLAPFAAPATDSLSTYLEKVLAAVALQRGRSSHGENRTLLDSTGLLHALQLVGVTLEARELHLPTILQHISPFSPPAVLHGVDAATFVRIVRWLQHGTARRLLDDGLLSGASTLRHGALSAASFASFWRHHQRSHLPRDAPPQPGRLSEDRVGDSSPSDTSDQLLAPGAARPSSPNRYDRASAASASASHGSEHLGGGFGRGGSDEAEAERAGGALFDAVAQGQGWLSGVALCEALCSAELNEAFDGAQDHVCHTMRAPLAHYLINSSHNTYLEGDQLTGVSSAAMYRRVLLTGCRCIELDLWDGEGEQLGQPVVTHGHTECTRVALDEVLVAIAEVAFVASPYPLILSLENHLSLPQQREAARFFKQAFGEALLLPHPSGHPRAAPTAPLPSPDALKGKVLLKGKAFPLSSSPLFSLPSSSAAHESAVGWGGGVRSRGASASASASDSASPMPMPQPSPPPSLPPLPPRPHLARPSPLGSRRATTVSPAGSGGKARAHPDVEKLSPRPSNSPLLLEANAQARVSCLRQQSIGLTSSARDPSPLTTADEGPPPSALETFQVAQELAELIYLETHKVLMLGWQLVLINHEDGTPGTTEASPSSSISAAVPNYRMSSHEEHSAAKLAAELGGRVWRAHNAAHLSRVYPAPARVDSSNYAPQPYWDAGVQMVALNFQVR